MTETSGRRLGAAGFRRRILAIAGATVLGMSLAGPALAAPPWAASPPAVPDLLESSGHSKWTRPLLGVVVGLDPGHNGGNTGDMEGISQRIADGRGGATSCDRPGVSTSSGYAEHRFTFDVHELLTHRLQYLGATVVSTRSDNDGVGPCRDVRGRFAEDQDVDLLLSLHALSSQSPGNTGFAVVRADPALSNSQGEPSAELAEAMAAGMVAGGFEIDPERDEAVTTRDGVTTLNFARRPAVRVELGQMYNPAEAALMESEEGRAAYADALTEGVLIWANGR